MLHDLSAEITRISPRTAASGTALATEGSLRDQLRIMEARLVQRVLDEVGDDRREAAQKLGIGLSSLYRKLEEFERLGLVAKAVAGKTGAGKPGGGKAETAEGKVGGEEKGEDVPEEIKIFEMEDTAK
jgi:hypothetical protein